MRRELRDKWCAALRSGEYAQARGVLQDSATRAYCCLGVLLDVMGERFNRVDGTLSENATNYITVNAALLVPKDALVNRNDGTNGEKLHTFCELADFIESYVPVED